MTRFLFIIGQPRCATTSFAQVLGQHPEVFLPKLKEPHYFLQEKDKLYMYNRKGDKIPFDQSGFISTAYDFDKNNDNYKKNCVYIDGSTLYAVHHNSIDEIYKQKHIDPYFVILKRDPFKRAVSHYLYSLSRGEEFRSFDKALEDEQNGLDENWLLKGYLAGSESSICEEKIKSLWNESKLLSVNIEDDDVFSQDFMNKILSAISVCDFTFDFSKSANALAYTNNRLIKEMRIFLKRIRQINPILIDNKFTRLVFNSFMKSIPVNKDVYSQYDIYKDFYYTLYNSRKLE